MGASVRLREAGSDTVVVHNNRPADKTGYAVYRRVMSHLSAIQDRHALYVEPRQFQHSWTVPAEALTPETFASLYKDFFFSLDPAKKVYHVSKRVNGRVMISNYDPSVLSNEERLRLHAEAEEAPANDVVFDIRAGHTGGEYPMHGRLRQRSFHEILTFIGRGIEEEPEIDVAPDPRTPTIAENPAQTLAIAETRESPPGGELSVQSSGYYYAVRDQQGYPWNRKAFSLLYQLFQMSLSGVKESGPAIMISK